MLTLVDSPGLWYRSFFGLPSSMRGPDGTQINAVRGFLDGLSVLLRRDRPTALVCALDLDWRPAWRVELLPGYKAHRADDEGREIAEPEALGPQVNIILELLAALGIATAGAVDHEADDVLATLAARSTEPVHVVTGDRDMFQLVSDDKPVRVVYIGRGVVKADTFDEAAVLAKFGVRPERYPDYAVLRGDPSDGLPGVKGVGDKTAAKLVNEYHGIGGILAAAADPTATLPPRQRAAILDAADYLAVAPKVVLTVADAPVPAVSGTLPTEPVDPAALADLTERYGLANPVDRLRQALGW